MTADIVERFREYFEVYAGCVSGVGEKVIEQPFLRQDISSQHKVALRVTASKQTQMRRGEIVPHGPHCRQGNDCVTNLACAIYKYASRVFMKHYCFLRARNQTWLAR